MCIRDREYLSDTYGITVYQEQVMLLSQKLAGFTGGEADTLRKAMGKKQRAVLDKMKPKFIEGCSKRGHDAKICEKIWGDWEAFASYAFNKSHSTCYAYIAYQTGYLKAVSYTHLFIPKKSCDVSRIYYLCTSKTSPETAIPMRCYYNAVFAKRRVFDERDNFS